MLTGIDLGNAFCRIGVVSAGTHAVTGNSNINVKIILNGQSERSNHTKVQFLNGECAACVSHDSTLLSTLQATCRSFLPLLGKRLDDHSLDQFLTMRTMKLIDI